MTTQGSVIKMSQGMTMIISPYDGQWQGNAGSVWESHDCAAGGPPGGGKQPIGTKVKGCPPSLKARISVQTWQEMPVGMAEHRQGGESHQKRCTLKTPHQGLYSLSESWMAVRQPEGKRYHCCWRGWLGPRLHYPKQGAGWRQQSGTDSMGVEVDSILSGKTSLTAVPSTIAIEFSGTSWLWEMVWKWESNDGPSKTAQMVLPWSKVKKVLKELHGGLSGHLNINKTLDKVRYGYRWLHVRGDIESWCQQCNTCTASWGPWIPRWSLMHQHNGRELSETISDRLRVH
jgi:hypothetical protein